MKPPYAIGSVPSLSGHAIAYRWRSLPRVRRHRASKAQGSSERVLPWQITMDQLIFASLSHTHYWYEVGMLKVPASTTLAILRRSPPFFLVGAIHLLSPPSPFLYRYHSTPLPVPPYLYSSSYREPQTLGRRSPRCRPISSYFTPHPAPLDCALESLE